MVSVLIWSHITTDIKYVSIQPALSYVLDPCYHNIPLIMVRSSDSTKIGNNEPPAEEFVSVRIILEKCEIEQMTDGIDSDYGLVFSCVSCITNFVLNNVFKGAEIKATRYMDFERYQFVYINDNQEPKQLAVFHHLLYGNSVYSNNFVSLISCQCKLRRFINFYNCSLICRMLILTFVTVSFVK